jgi:DNA polymerase-3 subunit alpha
MSIDALSSQPTKYVNLHVHSGYSLLDGMSKPEDIVQKVVQNKQSGFAITEHGNVFSAVKLYKQAIENNVKFIYGCEFYITEDRFKKDKNNKYYHLTVLAKNEDGRININKLVTLGYLEGFYSKPRIDHDLLFKHKDGLVVLSGCMASELQQTLAGGKIGDGTVEITPSNIEKAKSIARMYRREFGNDYYLEIQSHSDERQQKLNRAIVDIAKDLGIEYVTTADSHFVNEEDFDLHSIFIQIGQNREPGETYQDTFLQNETEVRRILSTCLTQEEIDNAIRNTALIMDKCNVKIPLSAPLIPHVDVPEQFKSEDEYLKHLCQIGWKKRKIHEKSPQEIRKYKQRLQYEFNAISKMGFSGYFLLVQSYANIVKRRGIARGSGGGSLVAYLLNIVDIDPIKYDLFFERFIDVSALDLLENGQIKPEELKIPDIDLDFGTHDREKVIQFIINKYGKDRVACIGNFQYIRDKAAIKDVGRVLGLSFEETNKITKGLADEKLEEALENGQLKQWEEKYPKLFDYAKKIIGLPRSFSMHPCGRIIALNDLTYYTALSENNGEMVLHTDMYDVEALGLVKIDTLGLRTVDVIYDVLEMIGKDYEYIAPANINFNDDKVLDVFRKGHTDGIFQFESDGMKQMLIKMQPNGLNDLGVANALYRPGAMKYIDNYIARKHGKEQFEYLHPDLEPILKSTYGIIVFQEQLIEIGRLAGMRNPDELRKATGKKKPKLMAKVEPELREGLYKRGWTKEQVDKLWSDMLDFAKYSFNKSHAYAYSIIAYITAFLKVYHPKEFICALFNSFEGKHERMKMCYREAVRLGVEISDFDYRNTSPLCTLRNGKIVYGTTLIKECNRQLSNELSKLGEYDSFIDLLVNATENCSINKSQMLALIKLGFFKKYGNVNKLLYLYDQFSNGKGVKYSKTYKENNKQKRIMTLKELEANYKNEESVSDDTIKYQNELLSFVRIKPDAPKSHVIITDIDTKYSPKLTLYQLATGKETIVKMSQKRFWDSEGNQVLRVGDIIQIGKLDLRPKMKKVDGKWVEDKSRKEYWMNHFVVVERAKK